LELEKTIGRYLIDSITLVSNIKNLGENTKPKCTAIKKTKLQSAK
jgi:hypothetical protein